MDHSLRDRIKARLASLRARFGDDDPDVQALAADVAADESSAPDAQSKQIEAP